MKQQFIIVLIRCNTCNSKIEGSQDIMLDDTDILHRVAIGFHNGYIERNNIKCHNPQLYIITNLCFSFITMELPSIVIGRPENNVIDNESENN
jgi:hypothetical protein